jgi:hypothetical protein
MKSKRLETKTGVIQQENRPGNYYEIEYYMTEGICTDEGELKGQRVFGLGIIKKNSRMDVEEASIQNLSCCREYTEKMMEKLYINRVTPVGLPYVIDDIMGV